MFEKLFLVFFVNFIRGHQCTLGVFSVGCLSWEGLPLFHVLPFWDKGSHCTSLQSQNLRKGLVTLYQTDKCQSFSSIV